MICSMIFYVLENIMNMGYMKDINFEENGTNIFFIIMLLNLTSMVLISIRNFRREIQ